MSLHRFFLNDIVLADNDDAVFQATLDTDDFKHFKACRITPGELIAVIDSDSDYFQVCIDQVTENGFVGKIASKSPIEEPSFKIDLFQGLPKGTKLDEIIRHGTEVGTSAFHLVECSRSIAKIDPKKARTKIDRLNRIAKSASMQAGRDCIASVDGPISIKEASELLPSYDCAIIFWEDCEEAAPLSTALEGVKDKIAEGSQANIAVFIGPEGGLDDSEVSLLASSCNQSYISTLGPNILRTETAGVVGCSLIAYELGAMGACGISDNAIKASS